MTSPLYTIKGNTLIKSKVHQSIREQERRIRDLINEPRKRYTLIKKLGLWHQLCSCLDVIGDTELAIITYTAQELGANIGATYLAVYGLLQALFLQQDAIFNLCESLGISDNISNYPGLQEIREIRNASIGHPTKRGRKRPFSYHAISRLSLSSKGFQLLTSDETGTSKFEWISIPKLIADQHSYASAIFTSIIEKLEQEEAAHKEQFKKEKLVAVFSATLAYHLEKVFESIRSGENPAFGAINLGILTQALKDLQAVLAKRGIELDTYEVIEDLYEELAYPMSELETYLQHLEKGQKPNINEKTAYIFAFFVTKKIDELKDVAKEIDEEYAQ